MAGNKIYDAKDNRADPGIGNPTESNETTEKDNWLQIATDAYSQSDSYFDANIRVDLEASLAHFQNKHAPGSKYYKSSFKHRHKGFRPKTRSMVRKKEAAAAAALFSTKDVVHVSAERARDKSHQVSAEINQELLQYRLSNTIPWFLTAIGAYQDTLVSSVCISYQYWDYREVEKRTPVFDDDGNGVLDEQGKQAYDSEFEVTKDTPAVDLRPIENVLFSTAADWRDPVNTSPFIIDKIPMFIGDVKAMAKPSRTSKIPWFDLDDATLLQGVTSDNDSIRSAREGKREDSTDQRYTHVDFTTVWVHRNIMNVDGRDWIFYTLGIHARLSEPVPLEAEFPHLKMGERPYVLGVSNIETHKNYPDSLVKLGSGAQQSANEINNQRRDNVALVLNRRYIVKRSAMVDYGSLQRNVPGGITETDDPNTDIKVEAPPDVTGSAYQEQDRINMDYDEVTGHFSSSSVGSNRQLNETVGGMNLLSSSADALTEYPLRVFVTTWVEPVLKQLIRLEQRHETDRALLALLGEKANLLQRFGINDVTDAWIQGSMNIEVNVGFGATNPQQRIEKISMGLGTLAQFTPQLMQKLDEEEFAQEVFGALGFNGAERFFPKDKEVPPPQPPPEVPMTAGEKAKLEQDRQLHEMDLQDKSKQREHLYHMESMKQKALLLKMAEEKTITMADFDIRIKKIDADRQNKVDEMKVKLHPGNPTNTGI